MARKRLPPGKRLRRTVHFLLNDDDYIRLLEHTTQESSISDWCRETILNRLAEEQPDGTQSTKD